MVLHFCGYRTIGKFNESNIAEHPRPESISFIMKTTESGTKGGPEARAERWV